MSKPIEQKGWAVASIVLGLSLLLILVLYQKTTLYLGGLWLDFGEGAYGHGFLVLLISVYMVYTKRAALASLTPCPSIVALVAVTACSALWMTAELASVRLVQVAVLLLLVMSAIWAVLGSRLARRLLLPVMFISFALPIWGLLLPILQVITAESAYWMTRTVAIPAIMQNFTVTLPSGQLSIEHACSGLNYLLAGVTLGVFYAFLNYRQLWHRLLVVLIAAGAAILANILRVFIIIWLAWKTDMQHPYVKDHLTLGWYLFAGLIVLLLVIDYFISVKIGTDSNESQPVVGGKDSNCSYGFPRRLVIYLVTVGLIAAGPAIAWQVTNRVVDVDGVELNHPAGASGWQGPAVSDGSWIPDYKGAIAGMHLYRKGDDSVYLFTGYYPRQSQGAELINELNRISNPNDWRVTKSGQYFSAQLDAPVIEAELTSLMGRKRLVWYRYRIAGRHTTSKYQAKLLQVAGLLTGKTGAAVIAVATEVDTDIEAVRTRVADFMNTTEQPLARAVDGDT